MSSDIPYEKLKNSRNPLLCCLGKKKEEVKTDIEACIRELNRFIRIFTAKRKHIEFQINNCDLEIDRVGDADELLRKRHLERKRRLEVKRKECFGYQSNVEAIKDKLEQAINAQILKKGLKSANKSLNQLLEDLDIASIEELMDNLNENVEKVSEINEIFAEHDDNDEISIDDDILPLDLPEVPTRELDGNNNNNVEQTKVLQYN